MCLTHCTLNLIISRLFSLSDLQGVDEQQPTFAILTANSTERMTVNTYLGLVTPPAVCGNGPEVVIQQLIPT